MMKIQVVDLGLRGYREVWEWQERLLDEAKSLKQKKEPVQNRLLLVEHHPVYTLGKSGDEANLLISSFQLQAKQAEFIKVDRGGDITFHGPGQLVVYPILDLEELGIGVKEYVYRLEEVVIRTIAEYGIRGERLEGATGVWLGAGTPYARKICAIGVKCSRYVTMHGFALNVNTDLSYFNDIHPCGFVDKGVTSIQRELDRKADMEEVKDKIVKLWSNIFQETTLENGEAY